MNTIELLAPAKNAEIGIAAIDCGADAVYIGAKAFGAREAAGNSVQDIARLTQYAHKYWARVYVTLNTILYDDEFPEALRLIDELYHAGIDGLIVQDAGLLECDLPPLPLIASTQMHNATPEKIAFLERVGFQRVILARELNLEQIRAIRAKTTTIELECLVHGSLCVCYSGQCYMSYAIGGRSGNRGQCAQPCRRLYTLQDSAGKTLCRNRYLLSLKDMYRADYLRELIEAGVTSFKIEGRLKDESYVKNIVSYYRRRIDDVLHDTGLKKSSSGVTQADFTPDPLKTFQRGYTDYFLTGNSDNVASLDTPKSIGEPIGKVIALTKATCTLDSNIPLHTGDGLCFFDRDRILRGTLINAVTRQTMTPDNMQGIEIGTFIYRNYDREFVTLLKKSRIERRIAVTLTLTELPNGVRLAACDEDGNQAEAALLADKQLAKDAVNALATLEKQLKKFGATEFICEKLIIELSAPYFFPVAQLNALRRNVLEQLATVRAQQHPILRGRIIANSAPYPELQLSYLGNVLNKRAEAFYRRHGVTQIQPAAESGLSLRGKKVMTTKYCLKRQLDLCGEHAQSPQVAEPLFLIDEHGQKYRLHFDCARCEMDIFFG